MTLVRRVFDAEVEDATPDAIRQAQLAKLNDVLASAAANPFYAKLWKSGGAGDDHVSTFEEFGSRYPIVRKADFIADQDAAPPFGSRFSTALNAGAKIAVCTTSGTSGKGREVHVLNWRERGSSVRPLAFAWSWAGIRPADNFYLMLPVNMLAGGRLSYDMASEYGMTVFPIGSYEAEEKLEVLRRFPPGAATANASYFMRLAHLAGDDPPQVNVLHLQGEGMSHAKLEEIEDLWRGRVMYSYGSTQALTDHMCTCENGIGDGSRSAILHNIDSDWLLEVIDPESGAPVKDGERGELVITSLSRTINPLIRCGTEDLGIFREPGCCPCGRPFMGIELGSITRAGNVTKVKGVNVWFDAVETTVFSAGPVKDFRVVVDQDEASRDRMTVRAVVDTGTPADLAGHLEQRLRETLGISVGVELAHDPLPAVDTAKAKRWTDLRG
jgi:phenylacetate-CoA ligase